MAKVTRKLQITIPKALADRAGIRAGQDIAWYADEGGLRVVPVADGPSELSPVERAREFMRIVAEHRRPASPGVDRSADRGWMREDLYDRGVSG